MVFSPRVFSRNWRRKQFDNEKNDVFLQTKLVVTIMKEKKNRKKRIETRNEPDKVFIL
jgi:arabinogalactan endo-1,4-beta-galactosidase